VADAAQVEAAAAQIVALAVVGFGIASYLTMFQYDILSMLSLA
jgi:hypothetical protein